MAESKRLGRPPLPASEGVRSHIRVRISAADKALIDRAAIKAATTASDLIRDSSVKRARRILASS